MHRRTALFIKPDVQEITCPLCEVREAHDFFQEARRTYYQCSVCGLVFVPSGQHLSDEEERKRYGLHRNSTADAGYRAFLNRLFAPLQQCLSPESNGLDFGCGPAPVLAIMFREAGHSMSLFDRFFVPDPAALERQYDFITAAEVVEHLRDPRRELDRLWSCLKQGGRMGIMTQMSVDRHVFPNWHYKNDPTHIRFFSRQTFAWLGARWDAEPRFTDVDVVLFQKGR